MTINDKEAFEPFLNGDHDSGPRDDSLELPELVAKLGYGRENHDEAPFNNPSRRFEVDEGTTPDHKPPVKRSATYAILFMLGAQVFSASMNVSIRLLENASTHLHPLQVSLTDPPAYLTSFTTARKQNPHETVTLTRAPPQLDSLRPYERNDSWYHIMAVEAA